MANRTPRRCKAEIVCPGCGENSRPWRNGQIYCSLQCKADKEWADKKALIESGELLLTGWRIRKRYLMETLGERCQSPACGWDWSKPCGVEVEHIDGDATNNSLSNLTLLCPNCHSLTKTYKAKNRGRGRHARSQRYRDGKSY